MTIPPVLTRRTIKGSALTAAEHDKNIDVFDHRSEGIVSVKSYGAKGDNTTDDTAAIQAAIDACFGPSGTPNGNTNAHLNKILYFPPGCYITTVPLLFTQVRGARILGAGRFVTQINNVAGTNVINTNGFEYCHVEGFQLRGTGSAVLLNLDWDRAPGTALQSNTFVDMYFEYGSVGVEIGASNNMGSENTFLNCFWQGQTVAGLKSSATNALQNQVLGGNFQNCDIGIWVLLGAVAVVQNVGFQVNASWDIKVEYSGNDIINIIGCRSESLNFYYASARPHTTIMGCNQYPPGGVSATGYFAYDVNGKLTVIGCVTTGGQIQTNLATYLIVDNCSFGRDDWLNMNDPSPALEPTLDARVHLRNVMWGATTNETFSGRNLIDYEFRTSTKTGGTAKVEVYTADMTLMS